jgi:hypothetical protein
MSYISKFFLRLYHGDAFILAKAGQGFVRWEGEAPSEPGDRRRSPSRPSRGACPVLAYGRVLNDQDWAWRILENAVSGAPEEQTSETSVTMGTNHD